MSFVDKLRTQKLLSFTLILFTLSVGIVIGTLINSGVKAAKDDHAIAPGATPLQIPSPVELSNQFTQIAKQVEPSVVHIATSYGLKQNTRAVNPRGRRQLAPPEDDDQGGMEDFFQHFFGGNPFGGNGGPQAQPRGSALGSGVVVDRAGYILTNNHVVDKADRIQVKFPGDTAEYEAKVIGTDSDTDLAVIRVEGKSSLVAAKIGNSDAVQVGDWCVAIGSPFGFQATVTAGIISAKERDVPDSSQFQHFLQTDAAINPGNSGGPLLNIRGEVVGINTAIATRTGGYQGIGFALPINTAANVYNQIIKTGKVTRGSIGITFSNNAENTRNLLKAYGHGATEGVFVASVQPGGPSEKAGLKAEDIITAVNGKQVRDGNELVNIVSNTPVGTPLDLNVLRDGKRENFKVTVADLAQVFPERYGRNSDNGGARPEEATSVSFGVSIQSLTPQMRDNMGLKQSAGVLIADVDGGSFADDIGLEANDVITSINQQSVSSVEDVKKLQGNLKPGDAVAFRVLRRAGGQPSRGNRNSGGEWAPLYLAGTLPHHMQ
jgi:serine protease Do